MIDSQLTPSVKKKTHPFRRAVLRGLALVLPPLLTIVLLAWVWNAIESNILRPIEALAKPQVVWLVSDIQPSVPADLPIDDSTLHVERLGRPVTLAQIFEDEIPENLRSIDITARGGRITSFTQNGTVYRAVSDGEFIPDAVAHYVDERKGRQKIASAEEYYDRYVQLTWMNRWWVIPIFLCIFVLVLSLLGRFLAAGIGRSLWNLGESIVSRLPIIRNVYSSVKQVTDFIFTEQDLAFTRVVAVEYPRKGIWSLAFVTGEGMFEIGQVAGEKVISVLIPTSPMPATGFTMTVKKSDTIEIDITMDQALQFIVSCGVVLPPQQLAVNRVGPQLAGKVLERIPVGSTSDE